MYNLNKYHLELREKNEIKMMIFERSKNTHTNYCVQTNHSHSGYLKMDLTGENAKLHDHNSSSYRWKKQNKRESKANKKENT